MRRLYRLLVDLRFFQVARLALGGGFLLYQDFPIRDRHLVIVGMDFIEGEKAMAVTAIFHKGRLKGRFDPGYFREINIAFELFSGCRLVIKFFKTGTLYDNDACLLFMRRVD